MVHQLFLNEFIRREQLGLITRAKLARKLGLKTSQITRLLGTTEYWTKDTLSDLMLGMGCEPNLSVLLLSDLIPQGDKETP